MILKMRKNIFSMLLLSVLFLLPSCNDYLDVDPDGVVTEEYIKNSINNLNPALAGVYSKLAKNNFTNNLYRFGEAPGDNVSMISDNITDEEVQIATFNVNQSNEHLLEFWETCYQGILAANDYLNIQRGAYDLWMKKVDKIYENPNSNNFSQFRRGVDVNGVNVNTAKEITYFTGEAHFLRALYYFYLVRTFGGVPIMPEKLEINAGTNNFYSDRASVKEVYEYIEKDLRIAMVTCRPPTNDLSFRGRVNKGAAAAFLIKVLGYQASIFDQSRWADIPKLADGLYLKNTKFSYKELLEPSFPDVVENWEDCINKLFLFKYDQIKVSDEISMDPNYDLFPLYDQLGWLENEFNQELIFEINFNYTGDGFENDNNRGTNVWSNLMDLSNYNSYARSNSKVFTASKDFLTRFANMDDPGINRVGSRDPRAVWATVANGFQYYYEKTLEDAGNLQDPTNFNRSIAKYYISRKNWPVNQIQNDNPKNVILMRLGEVILWHAEALNEIGQGPEAIALINQKLIPRANELRNATTAGRYDYFKGLIVANEVKQLSNLPVLSQELNRVAIWDQRRVELCFEWDRFYDIVRTGQAEEALATWQTVDGNFSGIADKNFKKGINEIFPIPQSEIEKAGGRWLQNPGY
jgi:starch-binding outer membrane protein, SusD/RagB family